MRSFPTLRLLTPPQSALPQPPACLPGTPSHPPHACGTGATGASEPSPGASRLPAYKAPSSQRGTFVSAFAVLCGARTDLPDRHVCCVFWLNIAAALIQTLTAIVMVGWIMSIFWGMDMVILASYKEQGIPQQL
ncbi:protein stum homolog isoform X2 [Acinonyx jubatus]|uniref:Protein stum homolog isoform X2 n=1 Tax=Acinonyx jubatus TaxID=32536 RepID=A0ABM3NZN9_ACIJB|nr:protein stum homolog isoform X2 [Acinonyx jubatus]